MVSSEMAASNAGSGSVAMLQQQSSTESLPRSSGESLVQKLRYPKAVFFIATNVFFECFNHFGLRGILSIYLTDMLLFSLPKAKVIYHTFIILVYFFPLFSAMLADSLLGKCRTILYVSIIYTIGVVITTMATTPILHPPQVGLSLLGFGLIAIGIGGSKPCVTAFGADQFVLPDQQKQLSAYFSLYFFMNNFASVIATFGTPLLHEQHCFGKEQCYTLAFGVPGAFMITSLIIFALGLPLYKIRQPEGNMMINVSKCIGHSLKKKWNSNEKKEHWLDFAEERYGEKLVNDVKTTLRIVVLYLPLPMFWALYDQIGTGWTFMARNMNGDLGSYTIPPDQMQVINPFLVVLFVPLVNYVIFPMLEKMSVLRTPLQRLVSSLVLTGLSFFMAAGLSMVIEANNPVSPQSGEGQLVVYNNYECNLKFTYKFNNEFAISEEMSKGEFKIFDFKFEKIKMLEYKLSDGECLQMNYSISYTVKLEEEKSIGLLLNGNVIFEDELRKDITGLPSFRVVVNNNELNDVYQIAFETNGGLVKTNTSNLDKQQIPKPQHYTVKLDGKVLGEYYFWSSSVHTVVFNIDKNETHMHIFEVTPHNTTISMLWIVPQYIFITLGEVIFQVTGLEFSYSQAPSSMKSVLQACWLLNTAFGDLIVVIIESTELFEKQSLNFFLYSGLMVVDIFIFILMAMRYKYVKREEENSVNCE